MNSDMFENFRNMLNCFQECVLFVNDKKEVSYNDKFMDLFNIKGEDFTGIKEILKMNNIFDVFEDFNNIEREVSINNNKFLMSIFKNNEKNIILLTLKEIVKNSNGIRVISEEETIEFKDLKEVKNLDNKLKVLENIERNRVSRIYKANYTFEDIITQNKKMIELKDIAKKSSNSSSTILIQGESGTGKEYFAHAIHDASYRKNFPFVRINCAAIPKELLESEFFGYEPGAFTGAKKEGKVGKLELAEGGTLLLDEISSMSLDTQAKLLRVLEEREFERVGGSQGINIDIRVISCSNKNLQSLVNEGLFREDLYFRLNVVELNIPPLRERLDDISLLSENILNKQIQNVGLLSKILTEKALSILKLYDWPGNVRELRNILERAVNISSNEYIDIKDLPDYINTRLIINGLNKRNNILKDKVAEAEVKVIIEALKVANGSRTEAAKILGIHRTALYKKLELYGIDIKNM